MLSSEIKLTNFQNENSILSVCTRSNTFVPSCDGCSKLQQAMNTLCQHLEKLIFSHTLLRLDQNFFNAKVSVSCRSWRQGLVVAFTIRGSFQCHLVNMSFPHHECWKPFISSCRWCFDVSAANSTCAFDVFLHFLPLRSWWVLPFFQKCPYFSLISIACAFFA